MSSESLTIAVGQTGLGDRDKASNVEAMADLAAQASQAGAALLILPELVTTGYGAGDAIRDLAEPADGPTYQRLAAVAQDNRIALCYGYAEAGGPEIYNSAALIGTDGRLHANHRKTHLYGDYERALFASGDNAVTLADVGGFTVAMLICYEVEFPELVRKAAIAGAELIAVPTATAVQVSPSGFAKRVVASRATENNIFVAYANHCGADSSYAYLGESLVAGPLTDLYATGGAGQELLTATLDKQRLAEGDAIAPYHRDRRPELYGDL